MLIAISTGLLTFYYTGALGDVAQRFVYVLRRDLFAHMQVLSLRFHDCQRSGDLIMRLTSDVQSIQDVMANGSILLVTNATLLAGMLALMLWLNWQFTIIALSVAPFLFYTVVRYTYRIKVAARDARRSDGLLSSLIQETLTSIRVVQGLAQEDQQNERFAIQNNTSLEAYLKSVQYQARVAPLVDVLAAVALALVMWYGSMQVLSGNLTTGDLVVFFAYITNLYAPIKALSRLSYGFNKASIAAERITDIMRVDSEVKDIPNARTLDTTIGELEMKHVSFAYESGRTVLEDINLTARPGETIALVGATGAGKSTLVSLILRLYDPTMGAVCLDGVDVRQYRLRSLRDQIGIVLQDSLLFSGSIRENIAFGRPDARDDEILAAARVANAHEFIDRFPKGYSTHVSERGSSLSGGQKQRIAIARAVLRNASILILDEPTSGLDAVAEQAVVEALHNASVGRTTFLIAHRLTTARFADRIIVLEHGRIVEQGTHSQLLSRGGQYGQLHKLQIGELSLSI